MKKTSLTALLATLMLTAPGITTASPDGQSLFKTNCTMCHDVTRKKLGPPVKEMNKDPEALRATIAAGRNAMPSYESKLSTEEISALVNFLVSNQ